MTGDVVEFLAAAGSSLERERARNTVLLTVTAQLRSDPARHSPIAGRAAQPDLPLFGWWAGHAGTRPPGTGPAGNAQAGSAQGGTAEVGSAPPAGTAETANAQPGWAFMHTPPFPLVLSGVPGDIAAGLATALAGRPLRGVNAYPEAAGRFAATWGAAAHCQIAVHNRQRLYRLAELAWPDPAPEGEPRGATEADVPLVAEWFAAFARETHDLGGQHDQASVVRDRLSHGGVMLWVTGGVPVSVAAASRQVAGMIRVGPVYTPPELRGHGYASAVTAALSRQAMVAGAEEVVLYTDLANPVSNSIYQRIGYQPVEDRVLLAFTEFSLPARNLAFAGVNCLLEGIVLLTGAFFV